MNKLTLAASLALVLAGCGSSPPPPPASNTVTAAPKPVADQPVQPPPPQSADQPFAQKLDQVLAGSWRSDKNKARDQYRHPKQTLEFFGLKSGHDPDRTDAGRRLVRRSPRAAAQGQRQLHRRHRHAEEEGRRRRAGHGRADARSSPAIPASTATPRSSQFDPKAPNLGPPGSADMVRHLPQRAQLGDGRYRAEHVQGLLRRAQARRRARRRRSSRRGRRRSGRRSRSPAICPKTT